MLYIRADGNAEIGMGHVMRCLSVAEAAAEMEPAVPPVFLTADDGCRAMIEERGFRVVVLGTDYRDMMSELVQLEKIFRRGRDILLVDSYQASGGYYLALRKYVRVACFEDMGQAYPVDLLINYNIYAPDLKNHYRGLVSEVLLGAAYVPLRGAFRKPADYVVNSTVTNVMITTGGSDPCFAAPALVDALCSDSVIAGQGVHLHVISGPFNRFAGELKRRYQDRGTSLSGTPAVKITIHENVKDMRSLFLESDVVVTAAGSTIYEVSSLGVPMIVFYFAENQRQGAEAVERLTDIVNAGCFAEDGGAVADRVRACLSRCICDRAYRELLCQQERGLVDARGALRIAERLRRLAAEPCMDEKKNMSEVTS